MPEPSRIRDARREGEEYEEFRAKAMRGPGRHASLIQPASGHCARWRAAPRHAAPVKYLLKIDLSCLDGQPSCPRGGSSDQTERCEGPAAVPVEGQAAADGNSLRTASRTDGGRPPLRSQCPDDPALAGAGAWGRG